jgi:molybdopterin synthase sulfur carrier subunit
MTVAVSVRIPTVLRGYTAGARSVQAAGSDIRTLVDELERRHPGLRARLLDETGALRRYVNIYVGEDDIRRGDGLATTLPQGAVVSIIPAVAGG